MYRSFCYVYLPHASQEDCTVGCADSSSCAVTVLPCCCLSFMGMFVALSDLRCRVPTSSKQIFSPLNKYTQFFKIQMPDFFYFLSENGRHLLANTCGQSEHPICISYLHSVFQRLVEMCSCTVLITTVSCHLSLLCIIKYRFINNGCCD